MVPGIIIIDDNDEVRNFINKGGIKRGLRIILGLPWWHTQEYEKYEINREIIKSQGKKERKRTGA